MELNDDPMRGAGTQMKALLVSIAAALLLTAALPGSASARLQPPAKPNSNVEIVEFDGEYERGTIVVRTSEKSLYYVLGDGEALRYPVAVGEPRFQWTGELWVSSKQVNPTWRPTARMRRENPRLPKAVGPGPRNPLGPRALYLGWGEYRIHGTNAPHSVGSAASSGCFRMHNADAIDLFDRVHIGAPVIVLQ
jgi:lipoprotein-anchoring transpeptidase ErfK/SrfK